jgi:hypothetical protein
MNAKHLCHLLVRQCVLGSLLIALSGCDAFTDRFAGKENALVIASAPLTLSTEKTVFDTRDKAAVVGSMINVCLPMRGDFPMTSSNDMAKEFNRLLGTARLHATIVTDSGQRIELSDPAQAWNLKGYVEESNELSACLSPIAGSQELEVGTSIASIEISSETPFTARGAYWWSRSIPEGI